MDTHSRIHRHGAGRGERPSALMSRFREVRCSFSAFFAYLTTPITERSVQQMVARAQQIILVSPQAARESVPVIHIYKRTATFGRERAHGLP
jgi:hypothetical protein